MTVGAKRLVEESLFFLSLFSRTRQYKIFCACAEDRNMAAFSQPNLKERFDRILQSFLMSEE